MSRPKKNQNQFPSSSPSTSSQTPSTQSTRGANSATVVVSMKAALRSALQNAANLHLKSLSGMASHYVLEGLKRDGLLPGQNPPSHPSLLTETQPTQQPPQQPQNQPAQPQTPKVPF